MPTAHAPQRRVVLVTGAAKRLGRSMAIALARAGWQVAVHYRHSASDAIKTVAACADLTGVSACFDADFEDEKAVRDLLARVVAHFGHVDAVVNSAALFEYDSVGHINSSNDSNNSDGVNYERLARHIRSNTAAPVLLAQALHAHIVQRQGAAQPSHASPVSDIQGVVINLLDQKLCNLNPDFFSYTLSKAALQAAGSMLALALAPAVRVVGIAPGLTLTSPMLSCERFTQLHRMSPLGRSSTPEDISNAVCFALDNRALTGTTLWVDGGQHLQHFARDFSLM